MAEYHFTTTWKLDAPVKEVWAVIENVTEWPEWWRGVLRVREIKDGHQPGSIYSHTWRSVVPYKLRFVTELTEVDFYKKIKANVTGELEGTGEWKFESISSNSTLVTYYWNVRTNRTWMNITAPFLSGIFKWSHDTIMRWGGEGMAKKLRCRIDISTVSSF